MDSNLLYNYLDTVPRDEQDLGALAFLAGVECARLSEPMIAQSIVNELRDQRSHLKLIASENFSSLSVQAAMGNLLTDKYAEGIPQNRFYAGCANVDDIEELARGLACRLFGAEHAYVQPHSGADANMVAFLTLLSARVQRPLMEEFGEKDVNKLSREDFGAIRAACGRQRLMAMDLYSGGHLTHGYRHNFSSLLFDVYHYCVDSVTHLLDLDKIREQALEVRPFILLAGYSAYSRKINFAKMRDIAEEVGAVLMVDMAHFAGLVAGGVFTGDYNPIPHAHIVTTTTHKTLRGPRGGMVLCQKDLAEFLDRGCPAFLGGPLPHVIAAKAVAFREALQPSFKAYAVAVAENASLLAQSLAELGAEVVTGGTDNHLMLLDVGKAYGLTGRQAESALRASGITLNRNALPFDANGPWYTSGLRLGTPAVTSLGMSAPEMGLIAEIIHKILGNTAAGQAGGKPSKAAFYTAPEVSAWAKLQIEELLKQFPLYPEILIST